MKPDTLTACSPIKMEMGLCCPLYPTMAMTIPLCGHAVTERMDLCCPIYRVLPVKADLGVQEV